MSSLIEPEEPLSLTDPTAMRALAHPVRMALLELFAVRSTLTATQASEALGESPANCAFHLRTLAKYGFIAEAGGGRGRERPWQAIQSMVRIRSTDLDTEQARLAADALGQVWLDRCLRRIRDVFAGQKWSAEWEGAVDSREVLTFLTPAEMHAVREEIAAVLHRHLHADRRADPALRPAGAIPVEFAFFGYPRQDLADSLPDAQTRDIS